MPGTPTTRLAGVGLAAVAGGVAGLLGALAARRRRSAGTTADVWSRATRSLAERDLDPPTTVAVTGGRRRES